MQDEQGYGTRIAALGVLIADAARKGEAPVESWQPAYCGDIGLAIRADGVWEYRESPIRREALVKLFARVLRKDADGATYLVTPVERVLVRVADAPFLAVEMQVEGAGADRLVTLRTNVDDIVRIGPAHPLRLAVEPGSGGLKPYVLVRGRLEALLTRALTYDLLALAEEREGEGIGLWSGGVWWRLH